MRIPAIWYFALAIAARAQVTSESLLAGVRQKVLSDLARLPNFTCAETIERSRKPVGARAFESVDRVRVEVGYSVGNEVFGWPGGEKLSEDELPRLVAGTTTNGDFALLVGSIFGSATTVFTEAGEENRGGRLTLRYNYRVPIGRAGWRVRVFDQEAIVGFHGSVWVDKNLLDLVELDAAGDDLPQSLGFKTIDRMMQYARVRIGAADFLLPGRAVLHTAELTGGEIRNETRFNNCRQYIVEASIRFDEADSEVRNKTGDAPGAVAILPERFEAELALASEIDSDVSAVGDPFTADLLRSIRRKGETVIPKGAVLHGRIMRLELIDGHRYADFAFLKFEAGGRVVNISARKNALLVEARGSYVSLPGRGRSAGRTMNTNSALVPGPISSGPRLRLAPGYRLLLRSASTLQ
jgi:hypothetical protein